MLVYTHRCHFCGQTYHYHASGDGCLEPTNDEKYCPRCKNIIINSLKEQVPKDDILKPYPKEVDKLSDEILEKMNLLKNKHNCFQTSTLCCLDFNNIEIYVIDNVKYYIAYNNINEKHYFIEHEYCCSTKEFKKIYYRCGKSRISDYFIRGCNLTRMLSNNIKERKLDEPTGKINFNLNDWDLTWDVVENKNK